MLQYLISALPESHWLWKESSNLQREKNILHGRDQEASGHAGRVLSPGLHRHVPHRHEDQQGADPGGPGRLAGRHVRGRDGDVVHDPQVDTDVPLPVS